MKENNHPIIVIAFFVTFFLVEQRSSLKHRIDDFFLVFVQIARIVQVLAFLRVEFFF